MEQIPVTTKSGKILRVPDLIELSGFKIPTRYNPTLIADKGSIGEYCERTIGITLDSNLSPQKSLWAYSHEVVEAIIDLHHLDPESKMPEEVKEAFALGFYQVLLQYELFVQDSTNTKGDQGNANTRKRTG